MRVDWERAGTARRFSIETTAAVDRAVSALLLALVLGVTHTLSVPADVVRALLRLL